MSVTKQLMKEAAESIRTLVSERDEFVKKAEISDLATDIISTMVSKEMLSASDVLPKLAELQNRDFDELRIFKKALELGTMNMSKLGELSDRSSDDGLTPEQRFIQNVVGDVL